MTVLIQSQLYITSDSRLSDLFISSIIVITCEAANVNARAGLKDVL